MSSKTLLPKKRKVECPARHVDIAEPRKMVNEAFKLNVISNSEGDYDNLQEENRKLQDTYDKIEKTVTKIENANQMVKHTKCWKLINDMTEEISQEGNN